MECMAQEPVLFEDILCQIIDMIGPEVHFSLFCAFTDGFISLSCMLGFVWEHFQGEMTLIAINILLHTKTLSSNFLLIELTCDALQC
jgi:hypothetical protein